MSPRLRLFLADARQRPGRLVGVIVTCLITATVVGASALLLAGLVAWRSPVTSHVDHAAAVVVARLEDGLRGGVVPAETAGKVDGLAGVSRVVDYHDRWLSIQDGDKILTGPDGGPTRVWNWSAARTLGYKIAGSGGSSEPKGTDLVLDTRLAERLSIGAGDQITTISASGSQVRRVAGLVTAPSGSAPILLLSDAELARQPGSAGAQALLIFSKPGVSRDTMRETLAAHLDGERFEVVPPDRYLPGPGESAAAQMTGGLDLFSLLLFVLLSAAAVVLGTTLSLWTGQRLPHLTIFRALGVSATRIRLLVLVDVLRIAVPSALLGAGLGGPILANWACSWLVRQGLLPEGTQATTASIRTVLVLTLAIAATVLMALAAAVNAVLAAGRVDPAAVLRTGSTAARLQRRWPRLIGGLLLLVPGLIPMLVTIGASPLLVGAAATGAAIMIVPALALLSPWLVPALAPLAGSVLRLVDRRVGFVAAANLRTASVRTAALAGPALLGVGLTTVFLGAPRTVDAAIVEQTGQLVTAERLLVPDGTRALPLTRDGAAALGVIGCVVVPPKDPNSDVTTRVPAAGVDPASVTSLLDLDLVEGDLNRLTGETFAAGIGTIKDQGWRVGHRARLQLPDGQWRSLRLVASYRRDLGFAGVLLPRDLAVSTSPDPGIDLAAAAGHQPTLPGTEMLDRAEYLRAQEPRGSADSLATLLLALTIAGYALISLANTAALSQADRNAERATIRMIGAGRRVLVRLIVAEVLGAVGIGVVLGFVVAAIGLVPMSLAVGHGLVPTFDPLWTAMVPAMCFLSGVIPALLVGRPLRRVDRLTSEV